MGERDTERDKAREREGEGREIQRERGGTETARGGRGTVGQTDR